MTATDAEHRPHGGRRLDPTGGMRLDIEGLRGIAVGLVLLYHLGLPGLSGGFAGVDVFFVISGFLITGLMLREIDRSGTVSLRRFYARRARRLLPAASVVLVATAAFGWWLLPGSAHENLGRDVVASTVYLVNWELADRSVDYLAEGDLPSALQHYWSLSVEEQFYVVWPLLILAGLLLARRAGLRPKRVLGATILVVGLGSFVWSVLLTATDPARAYFVSTTRVWELAIGAALAFGVSRLPALTARAAEGLAWIGAAAVLVSAFAFTSATPWPGWAAAVPTLGTAALLAAGSTGHLTLPGQVLSWRPLVALGGVSYAVYLWHWPIIVIIEGRWGELGFLPAVGVGAASIGLAWLTGQLVERPIRFSQSLSGAPLRSLGIGAMAMALTTATGAAVVASVPELPRPGETRLAGARALVADPSAPVWTVREDAAAALTTRGQVQPIPALAPDDAPIGGCQTPLGDPEPRPDCVFGDPDGDITVAMIGDSKMGQWFDAINRVAKQEGWRLQVNLKSACAFSRSGVVEDCAEHTAAILDRYSSGGAPDRVIVSQRIASSYDDSEGGFAAAIQELVDLGIEVVVLPDTPSPGVDALYDCVDVNPADYGVCGFDRDAGIESSGAPFLVETAAEMDLPVVDLTDWICPPSLEECPPAVGGVLVYRQGSHLTDTYVRTLTPMLYRGLAQVGWTKRPESRIPLGGPRAAGR